MSLDRYLEQLTEDMQAAAMQASQKNKQKNYVIDSDASLEQHFRDVESYVYSETEPLSKIVGISTVQLPPPDKLSQKQQAALYKEMESLLQAFNFYPDFPEKLPPHLKYKVMRDNWEKEQLYMESGESHLEFCYYEPKECPFPAKYCMCRG